MERSPKTHAETLGSAAAAIRGARRVVVLTGAGISTDSGVPDFRGPKGVWTKDPEAERMATLQHYMSDPELRVRAWQARLDHPGWRAQPNSGHRALVELEGKGKLQSLITQNIDGLHQAAGTSPELMTEIHGTMREVICMSCADRAPMQNALDRVRAGEADPSCRSCGGILKSATISFGQNLVPEDLERARREAESCDAFIAVGTSLTVYPVAYLPRIALDAGAWLLVMNEQETPLDDRAHSVIQASIGDALPALVDLV